MNRIERLHKKLRDNWDHYGISAEKAKLVIEVLTQNEGYPEIVKRARAYAHYLDNRTIFIEDDQLLAGYTAAKQFYLEYKPISSAWPDDDFDNILKGGFSISPEDRKTLRSFDSYWHNTGREFGQLECFDTFAL